MEILFSSESAIIKYLTSKYNTKILAVFFHEKFVWSMLFATCFMAVNYDILYVFQPTREEDIILTEFRGVFSY